MKRENGKRRSHESLTTQKDELSALNYLLTQEILREEYAD